MRAQRWSSCISREEGASRQPVNQTLWGEPRESLNHERSQGGRGKVGTRTQWAGQKKKGWGAQGRSKRRELREPGIYLRNKPGACRQRVISVLGVWPLIRRREPAPHTRSCLALAWILPGWGSPSWHQGHASWQDMASRRGRGWWQAGRPAPFPPQSTCLACPFLLK